jgi:cation:H+ antiporter
MPDFASLSLPVNIGVFLAGAAIVWLAGTKVTHFTDAIARRFGIGQAAAGILILAGVTSLPEIATSFSAAVTGDAALAVNNLLGSIALQVALLALADLVFDKRALTSIVPDPGVMLQGALNVVLLAGVAVAVIYTDRLLFGAGLWTWGLAFAAAYGIRKLARGESRRPWVAQDLPERARREPDVDVDGGPQRLFVGAAVAAAAILVAGYVVATSGAALAMQTGLGSSFMGVAFLALATSLPELSTVFAAMRRGLYTMAISDILGTNIFNVALLLGIDLLATGEPVLTRVGEFSAVGALIGVIVTGLFVMGIAERRDRTIWRMGVDSAAVLAVYAGGLVMLYSLRSSA